MGRGDTGQFRACCGQALCWAQGSRSEQGKPSPAPLSSQLGRGWGRAQKGNRLSAQTLTSAHLCSSAQGRFFEGA